MKIKNYSKIIISILLLFLMMGCVTGGGGETTTDYHHYDVVTYQDVVYAEEDGHFNIQFTDDYRGYCFEYGEHEATRGDKFYVEQTDYILNSENKDVSNYLKLYFVDYYNETQKDKVVTQHTIWHFTDGFDGWRVNKTLVDNIKATSEYKKLPDDGTAYWNDTHNMSYSFRSLVSPLEDHQNFFAYLIDFVCIDNITDDDVNGGVCNCTNVTINNNYYNNTTNVFNNFTDIVNNVTNNFVNETHNYNNFTDIVNNVTNNYNNFTNNNNSIYINNSTNINNNNTVNNITLTVNNHTSYIIITYYIIPKCYNFVIEHHTQKPIVKYDTIHLENYKTGNPIKAIIIITLLAIIVATISYIIRNQDRW